MKFHDYYDEWMVLLLFFSYEYKSDDCKSLY